MKPPSKLKSLLQGGSSLRTLKDWIPNSRAERTQENRELARLKQEMEVTLEGVSPEERDKVGAMLASKHPSDAEGELLNYVVTEDHFKERRRTDRKGAYLEEGPMRDRLYWMAMVPVLIALYFIFSWLSSGHVRTH